MKDYIKQLEDENEELRELLAMSEEDNHLYKGFLPRWRKYTGSLGTSYAYMVYAYTHNGFADVTVAEVKQCNGITPDKTWMARMYNCGRKNFMEFYATPEEAMSEIQILYFNFVKRTLKEL